MARFIKSPAASTGGADATVQEAVSRMLSDIERRGTAAIREYSTKLDNWSPTTFRVSEGEIDRARQSVPQELQRDLAFALQQVRGFATLQRESLSAFERETLPGVVLGQKHIPVAAVGSYSPGGRYPLIASSIMTVATPKVAGVGRVVAAAPPRQGQGIHPPQLLAMVLSGADEIYCLGGVQALAALAYGMPEEGLKPVDMIVGAGNAFVAEAKRQLFGKVGIDLLAGPTEILVIADDGADPVLVAADLLGQAEHGPTSPAILLTTSEAFGRSVAEAVQEWLRSWPTAEVAGVAWRDVGAIVLCDDADEVIEKADEYAPEHLEVQTVDVDWYLERLRNYGTLFLGAHSTVAYSDKAIGTNHVLPTARAARYTGGLWVGKFLKTVTYQRVSSVGSETVAPRAAAICDAELMAGHAITARLRLDMPDLGARPAEKASD